MKSVGPIYARLGITLVIAILVASVVPTFVDKRDFVTAVATYEKNPTLENGVALARERAKNRRIVSLTRLGVAIVIFVIANVAWVLVHRQREIPDAS